MRAMWAAIGPITQIVNAANEPRKAIVELKFGTRIDTQTEEIGSRIRSEMIIMRFMAPFEVSDNCPSVESILGSAYTGVGLGSSPKKFSMMTLI